MALFATSHGITTADAMAGTLKQLATKASLQRSNESQIMNIYEFEKREIAGMSFCYVTISKKQNCCKKNLRIKNCAWNTEILLP